VAEAKPAVNESILLHEGAPYRYDYNDIFRAVARGRIPAVKTYRQLCREDLFFLLYFGLGRRDVNHPWLVARIREAEKEHYDTLDLWAREHYKSTIFTYGLPIQEVLKDPNERICIFSHTRPIAKGFLRQIKQTCESQAPLLSWFPDIFWKNPKRDAPKWSEDDGLILRRDIIAREATFEAWGLVDGQPTSKHFTIRVYDDVVTRESVTTPEMIQKTAEAYELSQSLGTVGGRKRMVGTNFHFADLYQAQAQKGTYHVRRYPATKDGTAAGEPVFLPPERLAELRREQGPYVFSCQQLLDPVAQDEQSFRGDWVRHYMEPPRQLNRYIICDPANEQKKTSDYTAMAVVGVDSGGGYFVLDLVRDRLNLGERWEALRDLYIKHQPVARVGYEKYGMQSDIAYMEERQAREGVYFRITPLGGSMSKVDRIRRLVPLFEQGRLYLPYRLVYRNRDLVREFLDDEYALFPYGAHDDMLDCLARILDEALDVRPPVTAPPGGAPDEDERRNQWDPLHRNRQAA